MEWVTRTVCRCACRVLTCSTVRDGDSGTKPDLRCMTSANIQPRAVTDTPRHLSTFFYRYTLAADARYLSSDHPRLSNTWPWSEGSMSVGYSFVPNFS